MSQAESQELVDQGKVLVKEQSKSIKDKLSFYSKIATASKNVQNVVVDKMTNILQDNMDSKFLSAIDPNLMGDVISNLGSMFDKISDPSKVTGANESADNSDPNFVRDQLDISDKDDKIVSGEAAGAKVNIDRIKDIAVGSLGAVSAVAPSLIPKEARNIQRFTVATSFLLMHEPKTLWGFAQEATEAFGLKNLERRGVLEAIKVVVSNIYDELEKIPDEWYALNLKQRILDAISDLESADSKLMIVRRKTYQSIFDLSMFEDAKDNVEDARDHITDYSDILDLAGNPLIVFSMVKVIGYLATLKQLTNKLEKLQSDLDEHKLNIEDFKDNFVNNSRYHNVSATMIANIQVQIRNTIREMNEAVSTAVKLKIINKMMEWVARLNLLLALMETTSVALNNYIDSDPDGYTSAWDEISDMLNSIDFHEESKDIELLIFHLRRYHSECLQKTSTNTDLSHIRWRKDTILDLAEEQLSKSSLVVDALLAVPDVITSLKNGGAESILDPGKSICTDVIGMADDLGFDRISKAIKSADWSTFFGVDANTASTEGKMLSDVSKFKKSDKTESGENVEVAADRIRDSVKKRKKQKEAAATSPETIREGSREDAKKDIEGLKELTKWISAIASATGAAL